MQTKKKERKTESDLPIISFSVKLRDFGCRWHASEREDPTSNSEIWSKLTNFTSQVEIQKGKKTQKFLNGEL